MGNPWAPLRSTRGAACSKTAAGDRSPSAKKIVTNTRLRSPFMRRKWIWLKPIMRLFMEWSLCSRLVAGGSVQPHFNGLRRSLVGHHLGIGMPLYQGAGIKDTLFACHGDAEDGPVALAGCAIQPDLS